MQKAVIERRIKGLVHCLRHMEPILLKGSNNIIYLFINWIGKVFWKWAYGRASLNSQWLVLYVNGAADFLYC